MVDSMENLNEFEFRAIVRQEGKVTIPKRSGIQQGDFVIIRVLKVPVE